MPGKKGGGGGGGGGGGSKGGATNGPDLIIGNRKDNVIDALGGDDKVIAGDGDDIVHGGAGDDELYGGRGDDELYGDDGDDFLAGNEGSDLLDGGGNTAGGRDIASYTGDPPTSGGPGGDGGYVFTATGPGTYTATGGGYVDTLINIEEIWGSNHNDTFYGGAGAEVFDGRLGNDAMHGGGGADRLTGSLGDDRMWGDAGDDTFVFHRHSNFYVDEFGETIWYGDSGDGKDVIWDYAAGDVIAISAEDPAFDATTDVQVIQWNMGEVIDAGTDTAYEVASAAGALQLIYSADGSWIVLEGASAGDLTFENDALV